MSGFKEDKRAARELEAATGKRVLGIECPLRNNTGDVCKECERVRKLWNANTADAEKEARDRQAKDSYFLNVMLRDESFTCLKIGKKVAKSLKNKVERYKEKTGAAFGYANIEDKGQWLAIHKSGEHPNFEYELEVLGEVAEPVEPSTVKGLPSLNNLTEDYNNGDLPLLDISSLSSGDSLEFRMVPVPTTDDKATEMVFRYFHWRCSQTDILGGADINDAVETGDTPPREFSEYMTVGTTEEEEEDVPASVEKYTMENKPECYSYYDGESDCFDEDCDNIRDACAKAAGYVLVDGEYVKKTKKKKMKA